MELRTPRLNLILQTYDEVVRTIREMSEYDRAQVSADWLDRLREAEEGDPWRYAFRVVHRETGEVVGTCSFKGPPADGIAEVAYGIDPEHRCQGYATEAAQALVDFASSCAEVTLVRAHTLPDSIASKRVLAKCGFAYVGETVDPEDGRVSRFEKAVRNG